MCRVGNIGCLRVIDIDDDPLCPMGVGLLHAKLTGGGIDAGLAAVAFPVLSLAFNRFRLRRLKLRRLRFFLNVSLRQRYPPRDMLIALKVREFGKNLPAPRP